jgi:hypothetical protein
MSDDMVKSFGRPNATWNLENDISKTIYRRKAGIVSTIGFGTSPTREPDRCSGFG